MLTEGNPWAVEKERKEVDEVSCCLLPSGKDWDLADIWCGGRVPEGVLYMYQYLSPNVKILTDAINSWCRLDKQPSNKQRRIVNMC